MNRGRAEWGREYAYDDSIRFKMHPVKIRWMVYSENAQSTPAIKHKFVATINLTTFYSILIIHLD